MARRAAGDLDGAFTDFTQALSIDPTFAPAYNSRGNVRLARREWDEAIRDYTRALQHDGRYKEAHCNRAVARLRKGDARGHHR